MRDPSPFPLVLGQLRFEDMYGEICGEVGGSVLDLLTTLPPASKHPSLFYSIKDLIK